MYVTKSMEGTSLSDHHPGMVFFKLTSQQRIQRWKFSIARRPFWSFPNPTPQPHPPKKRDFSSKVASQHLKGAEWVFSHRCPKARTMHWHIQTRLAPQAFTKGKLLKTQQGKWPYQFEGSWKILYKSIRITIKKLGCLCCHLLLQTKLCGFNLFKIYQRPSGQLWHRDKLLHMKKPSAHRHLEAFSTVPTHRVWGQKQPAKQVKFTEMTHMIYIYI